MKGILQQLNDAENTHYHKLAEGIVFGSGQAFTAIFHLHDLLAKALQFLQYQEIIQNCRSNLLSPVIMSPSSLQFHLSVLTPKLLQINSKLAFTSTGILYNLPFTRCFINSRTKTLTIRLDIPIISLTSQYQLYNIQILPFMVNHTHACQLNQPSGLLAKNDNQMTYLNTIDSYHCNLHVGYCQLSKLMTKDIMTNHCTQRFFLPTTSEEFQKHCPQTCFSVSETYVEYLTDTRLAILNPPSSAHITCQNSSIPLSSSRIGLHVVQLPCSACQLRLGETTYHSRFPCDDLSASVVQVSLWPIHLSNLSMELLFHHHTLTSVMNQDLTFNITPLLYNTTNDILTATNFTPHWTTSLDFHLWTYSSHYFDYFIIFWLIVLSILYVHLSCRIYLYSAILSSNIPSAHSMIDPTLFPFTSPCHDLRMFMIGLASSVIFVIVLACLVLYCCCRKRWTTPRRTPKKRLVVRCIETAPQLSRSVSPAYGPKPTGYDRPEYPQNSVYPSLSRPGTSASVFADRP